MQELSLAIELHYIAASAATAFATALAVSMLIGATRGWHIRHTRDARTGRPQRIHRQAIPRVGGVAILAGFVAGLVHLVWFGMVPPTVSAGTALLLMGALALASGCGLAEDLTHRVGPRQRLAWVALAALVVVLNRPIALAGIDVPALDPLFAHAPFAVAFTVFAVVGATNAYNIVDGLNGLLAGVSLITLAAVAWVAATVGDGQVFALAVLLGTATIGWLPYNWPRARLFAGDGGAYAIGFLSAVLLLMLVARNPDVSPWFGITAAALPVWETLYSIWRRARTGASALEPDQWHLHQLVRRRVQRAIARRSPGRPGGGGAPSARPQVPNGVCSPILWAMHAAAAVGGAALHDSTPAQVALMAAFACLYVGTHRALLREHARHDPALRT